MDLKKLRAADAMQTGLHWAEPGDSLRAAGRRMIEGRVRCLLVRGQPGDLPGILTSKDIVNLLGSQPVDALDDLVVADVMTRPAICVPAEVNLHDCLNLMRMAGVRRLPVLEQGNVVGILSNTDVFARVFGG
jgi:isocitrate dehydrogenase